MLCAVRMIKTGAFCFRLLLYILFVCLPISYQNDVVGCHGYCVEWNWHSECSFDAECTPPFHYHRNARYTHSVVVQRQNESFRLRHKIGMALRTFGRIWIGGRASTVFARQMHFGDVLERAVLGAASVCIGLLAVLFAFKRSAIRVSVLSLYHCVESVCTHTHTHIHAGLCACSMRSCKKYRTCARQWFM